MSKTNISGERLFLLYAFPCLEGKLVTHEVKSMYAMELNNVLNSGHEPSHSLLRECFKNAVDSFTISAGITSLSTPWPVEKVREFWRNHKGKNPQCATMHGVVEETDAYFVKIRYAKRIKCLVNRYNLSIKKGDTVYFHYNFVAEVVRCEHVEKVETPTRQSGGQSTGGIVKS